MNRAAAHRPVGIALLLLLCFSTLPVHADRDEERERKKAWEQARDAFLEAYRSEDPAVRRKAVQDLGKFADMGAAELLAEKVVAREQNYGVLEAAIAVIGESRSEETVGWLVDKARGKGDWQIRCAVAEALGMIPSPRADAALLDLLERDDDDPRVLTMVLFGLGRKKLKESMPKVLPFLEHDDWQVRVAAIEALGAFRDQEAVPHLIDCLMNERGRLREDIADALKAITRKDFGTDANAWRKWWHEKDQPPPANAEPPKPDQVGSTADGPTYFGIKVVSERVVFILDASMSMKTPIDVDKMQIAREAAVTGGDEAGEDRGEKFEDTIQWWTIKDRFDLAKAQLSFVIKNLKKDQQFEIVVFSDTVKSWNGGKLVKASSMAKTKAIQFVKEVEVEGATAAGAVLDYAFEMAGPGALDKNYKAGVDTIFFLSDGAPSDRPEDQILEEVKGRNRLRKIKVHVIAIINHSVRFLRLLAEQNGGIYKFFKVEDK